MNTQININMFLLFALFICLCVQALKEPAAYAKSTGYETDVLHEKLTITQARRGTPGEQIFLAFLIVMKPTYHQICGVQTGNSKE